MQLLEDGVIPSTSVMLDLYDIDPNTGELYSVGTSQIYDLGDLSPSERDLAKAAIRHPKYMAAINIKQMNHDGGTLVSVDGEVNEAWLLFDHNPATYGAVVIGWSPAVRG